MNILFHSATSHKPHKMTKTYNAKLVPMGKSGYDKSDIVKTDKGEVFVTNELGVNKDLIAQRLKITDDKGMLIASYPQIPNISYKIDLADVRKWIESGCKESVESEVETLGVCCTPLPGIAHHGDCDKCPDCKIIETPTLTNNTVKMVWCEVDWKLTDGIVPTRLIQDKAQPIAGDNGKPIVVERFACNGEHSHWEVIEPIDGAILWSGEDHHPATDWEALRDKFFKDAPLFNIDKEIAKRIFNFFKTEINGK